MYRTYMSVANYMNYKTQECWHTERGKDMEPIVSCEGETAFGSNICIIVPVI